MFYHNTINLFHDHIRGLAEYFLYFFLTYGCCSDALVQEEVGGNSVADIFKQHGETFFRNKEVSWKAL